MACLASNSSSLYIHVLSQATLYILLLPSQQTSSILLIAQDRLSSTLPGLPSLSVEPCLRLLGRPRPRRGGGGRDSAACRIERSCEGSWVPSSIVGVVKRPIEGRVCLPSFSISGCKPAWRSPSPSGSEAASRSCASQRTSAALLQIPCLSAPAPSCSFLICSCAQLSRRAHSSWDWWVWWPPTSSFTKRTHFVSVIDLPSFSPSPGLSLRGIRQPSTARSSLLVTSGLMRATGPNCFDIVSCSSFLSPTA